MPPSEQNIFAILSVLCFCSLNSSKLKDGSFKMQIRTEPKRTAASSVLNKENFILHTQLCDSWLALLEGKGWCLSCTQVRITRTFRHFLQPLNHYFFPVYPQTTDKYFAVVLEETIVPASQWSSYQSKGRFCPCLSCFPQLCWEGMRQDPDLLSRFTAELTVWVTMLSCAKLQHTRYLPKDTLLKTYFSSI